MLINGYPFPNLILLFLFFLLMWIDRKIMKKGGWVFYLNKIMILFSFFGSFVLVSFNTYSWILMFLMLGYSIYAYFRFSKIH